MDVPGPTALARNGPAIDAVDGDFDWREDIDIHFCFLPGRNRPAVMATSQWHPTQPGHEPLARHAKLGGPFGVGLVDGPP
jgi:hypothetical protein